MPNIQIFEAEIRFGNAALSGEGRNAEVVRILSNLVDRIKLLAEGEGLDVIIYDINGNRVGYATMPTEEID